MGKLDAGRLRAWLSRPPGERDGAPVLVVCGVDGLGMAYVGPEWIAQVVPGYPPNPTGGVVGSPGSDSAEANHAYVTGVWKDQEEYVRDHPGELFVVLARRKDGLVRESVFGPLGEGEILDLVKGLAWEARGTLPPALRSALPPPPVPTPPEPLPPPPVERSAAARFWRWFIGARD